MFHTDIPHLYLALLDAPIGSAECCAEFVESKKSYIYAFLLLSLQSQLCNPQVGVTILRSCASFCKLVH